MRTGLVFKIVIGASLLALSPTTAAGAAESSLGAAGWPGVIAAPLGTDDFATDYPYFAGYHERVSGPVTIQTVTQIADPGACDAPALVAGTVSILDADYLVAAAYTTSSCYRGEPFLAVDLIASDGTWIRHLTDLTIGDVVELTASADVDGTHLSAVNLTKGWTETLEGPVLEPARVAIGAVTGSDGTRRLPLPDFGIMPFTGTTVGSVPLGDTGARALNLRSNSGKRMTVRPIRDGTDFEVRFRGV